MNDQTPIRILGTTNSECGDLFTRLTKDLFFALGYDDLRLDVHKAGRELDIQGNHRLESRRVLAECKAHAAKMGGAELNKFFGVLSRERLKHRPSLITGYFVSLGGFTETGIEQELETGDDRIILLNAQHVVSELEHSRVLVTRTIAAERAGSCAQHAGLNNPTLDDAELLACQRGYVWVVYYSHGKEKTHFALIHADGTPLAESIAREVISADQQCGGSLSSLLYLSPPLPAHNRTSITAQAVNRYREWVGQECGYIQLDGLPADTDLSATRLKLERLFVPLKVNVLPKSDDHADVKQTLRDMIFSIGEVLSDKAHLAILAPAGGGKSTLLKRLATAYANPDRRSEISDDLPMEVQ